MMHVPSRSLARFARAMFQPTAPLLMVACVVVTAASLLTQPFSSVMLSLCLISIVGTIGSLTYNLRHTAEHEAAPLPKHFGHAR